MIHRTISDADHQQKLLSPWFLILIPILTYAGFALYNLHLPGVYYDEVLQVLPAMKAVGYDLTPDYLLVPGSVVGIGDFRFPLMTTSYLGALQTMLFIPVFAVFEPTVLTMRLTFIVLGGITIALTFVWARQLMGWRGALVASLLVATHAGYLFYTRIDNSPANTMLIIKLLMLISFTNWWNTGNQKAFIAGCFLMGLGIYDKANFVWLIAAGALVIALFAPGETWERVRGHWRMVAFGILVALLGAAPFLGYVVMTGGGPFRSFLSGFQQTAFGVDNTNTVANINHRFYQLWQHVAGRIAFDEYTTSFLGERSVPEWVPLGLQYWFMLLAGLGSGLMVIIHRDLNHRRFRFVFALFICVIVMVVLSAFTPTTLTPHHMMMIYPFPQIIVVYAALAILKLATASRLVRAGTVIAVLLVGTSNVMTTIRTHIILSETEAAGMWSAAIYELDDYLLARQQPVVCMDWGICHNLQMLSRGALQTSDLWGDYLYGLAGQESQLQALMEAGTVFVFHSPRYTGILMLNNADLDYPRQSLFSVAESADLPLHLIKEITQKDGDVLFELYAVEG